MYRVPVCTAFVMLSVGMPLRAMTSWLARRHAAQIWRVASKGIHRILFIAHRLNSESPSPMIVDHFALTAAVATSSVLYDIPHVWLVARACWYRLSIDYCIDSVFRELPLYLCIIRPSPRQTTVIESTVVVFEFRRH